MLLLLRIALCVAALLVAAPCSVAALDNLVDSTYSNILPTDYVGPEVCGDCHEKNFAHWERHPHSRMNAMATPENVLGDFSDHVVEYAGGRAVFRRDGDLFYVDYYRGLARARRFRVTRVIGWRYEQDYIAVQTEGPEPPDDRLYRDETRLRFSYDLHGQRFFPQSYMEPTEYQGSEYEADGRLRYDPFQPDRVPFNQRCARCHNTYPYALRLYKMFTKDGMLSGFAPGHGMDEGVVKELATQQGDLALLGNEELPSERFVTVGISCESCHMGGREHVEAQRAIRFVPTHPLLADWSPPYEGARKRPEVVNALCRQCHHSGASARDNWPDGSASVNSMEAVEMDRGACQSEMRCTHCHNPHVGGPPAGSPDRAVHIDACLSCHPSLQTAQAQEVHARHSADQASCLDCHMPRIVQGFGAYNRTHRISSPSEQAILATGMPNACNLCHLDKSLAWTRDQLAAGWGRQVQLSPALGQHFGADLQRAAGAAWLDHPFSMVRTVTAGAYARSPQGKSALPQLLPHLNEANAYVRLRFQRDIEQIIGRSLTLDEFDAMAAPVLRHAQVDRLQQRAAAP